MTSNKRMYFIRNMESLSNENEKEKTITEYEIIADANFVGELDYGPYYFTVWDVGMMNKEGDKRRLCLRVCKDTSLAIEQIRSAKKSGFYHGGDVVDELVTLSSLFLRRRLQLGNIVRMEDKPRITSIHTGWIDKPLIEGKSSLSELRGWLELVEKLDGRYHQKFILAARFYHQALLLIEEHPDMAYLSLISAIETLCQDYEIEIPPLSELDLNLSNLVNFISDEEKRIKLEEAILKREGFLSRKFKAFIIDHIEEDFWTENREGPESARIKPEELSNLLKEVYNQRSRTLHSGEPFPPSVYYSPLMRMEIPFGVTRGERKWSKEELIPNPHFFERLVNHVLKTYLKRNSSEVL